MGVGGRSNQSGEKERNDANRNESEIKHDCWEFGLSILATNALFCWENKSVLEPSQILVSHVFQQRRKIFPVCPL